MNSYPQTKTQILAGCKKPVVSAKKVANNTFRVTYEDGTSAIRFHDTDVVIFDGKKTILTSGGFHSKTTKERINDFSGLRMNQMNGLWYVNGYDFFDGITFVNGKPLKQKKHDINKINKLKLQIKKFVSLVDKVKKLPHPSGGDCWLCCMNTQEGKTMGELGNDNRDHLILHMKEKYLHGSLIVNALLDSGYRKEQIGYVFQMKSIVKRSLRKYLQRNIIDNISVK